MQAWDRDRTDPVHRSFLGVALLASATFGSFTLHLLPGFTPLRAVYAVAGTFLPVALLTFLDRFFRPADLPLSAEVSRFWAATTLVTATYVAVEASIFDGFGRTSPPDILLALYALGGFAWCGRRLWEAHQTSEQTVERSRIRLLLGLFTAAIVSTAVEQLVRTVGGPDDFGDLRGHTRSFALQGALPPVGAVLGAVTVYSLHYVVQLHRLLDLTEVFARLAALTAAASLLLLTTGVTMAWSEALADYPLHIAFQMFLASALFLSFYEPLRNRLEAWSGEWFNRQGRLLELTLRSDHLFTEQSDQWLICRHFFTQPGMARSHHRTDPGRHNIAAIAIYPDFARRINLFAERHGLQRRQVNIGRLPLPVTEAHRSGFTVLVVAVFTVVTMGLFFNVSFGFVFCLMGMIMLLG